jgi:hypothetical protein
MDPKTVFRAAYGIFYGRTPSIVTGTAHSQNGLQVIALDINCTATPALCPTFPNVFASIPTTVAAVTPNLYLFDKNYQQPYTQQFHFQFEREVFSNTVFSAEYQVFRGSDITRTRNANLSAPVATPLPVFDATGTATGETLTVQRFPATRPIPQFQRISLFESTAKSLYQGLSLQLNRRFSNRFQFNTSYTLSKAKDNKPDQTSVVVGADDGKIAQNQFDLSGEYGISDLDVRHRFIFSPVYETGTFRHSDNKFVRALLSDYLITGILSAQSGFTYSATVSNDPNNDGNTANDRAPGTLRNQFTTPGFYQIDLRVGRIIRLGERARLSLFAEGFNIFNSSNVQAVNTGIYTFATTGGGRLTRTTNFGTPRIFVSGSPSFTFNSSYNREFQLGARFDF